MRFVGMDPGITGGLALLNHDATRVKTWAMPTLTVTTGGRPRQEVDPGALATLCEDILLSFEDDCIVTIEQVSSSPQMGVASAFNFGVSYGMALSAFAFFARNTEEHTIRIVPALPAVWKRHMRVSAPGASRTDMKKISRTAAAKLWPRAYKEFEMAKDDGRAEAALLAEYGRLIWTARQGRTM